MTRPMTKRVEIQSQRYWGPSGFSPPPDTPKCGFSGELCSDDQLGEGAAYDFTRSIC